VRHLISKLIAGGLSAAVILLWWPTVFPSDTVASWGIRGLVWTLSFELMLCAFMPVEDSLWRTRAARRVRDRAVEASARFSVDSPRRRNGGRTVLAGIALAVPVALLAYAPAQPLSKAPPSQTVRHVTEVKRVVKIERRRVTVPVFAAVGAAPVRGGGATVVDSQSAVPSTRRSTARSTTPRRPTGQRGSDTTRQTQTTTTTPPRSADPPTATSPAGGMSTQPTSPETASQPKAPTAPRVNAPA
jgi:hypothetical protein